MSEQYTPPSEAILRAAILDVIDAGDTVTSITSHEWNLYHYAEAVANQQRLDFCDAVVKRLSAYKIDEAKLKQAMRDTAHLDPVGV